MANNYAKNLRLLRAECDSQANFLRALRYQIRQNAEDSRGRKQQCDGGECAEQERVKTVIRGGAGYDIRHGAEGGGGLVWIDLAERLAHRGRKHGRITRA